MGVSMKTQISLNRAINCLCIRAKTRGPMSKLKQVAARLQCGGGGCRTGNGKMGQTGRTNMYCLFSHFQCKIHTIHTVRPSFPASASYIALKQIPTTRYQRRIIIRSIPIAPFRQFFTNTARVNCARVRDGHAFSRARSTSDFVTS